MSSTHAFFAIDIEQFKGLFGSKNEDLLSEVLQGRADDIEELDESYEDDINDGELPNAKTALRQIFYGTIDPDVDGEMHAQLVLVLLEHFGEQVFGGENGVANVADHPYDSLILKSGPLLAIPEPEDVPEIKYLTPDQIDAEISLASATHDVDISDEMQEDIDAYIETLQKIKTLGKGAVSFFD